MVHLSKPGTERVKQLKEAVRVGHSRTGSGVFSNRRFRQDDLIGEISGQLIHDSDYGSDYCFELDRGRLIEPVSPFRFINHSCDANCEFDYSGQPDPGGSESDTRIFLFAARSINVNDQLTIDYNWAAESAIPCLCGAANCRGWIVASDELSKMAARTDRGALQPLRIPELKIQ